MPGKRGKHDVHIFEVDGKFKVRPAVISVGGDYKLSIRSYADCPALLRFPEALLARDAAGQSVTYHVLPANGAIELEFWRLALVPHPPATPPERPAPSGAHPALELPKLRPPDGVYSYQVDMLKDDLPPIPALGESGPKIIVDP